MSVNRSSENMLTHTLLSFLLFKHGFIQIRFGLFEFFSFCFISHKYYLILLDFRKHNFLIDEKHRQWNLDFKVKVFHKVFHMFHEMALKLHFMKWSGRKVSQCIQLILFNLTRYINLFPLMIDFIIQRQNAYMIDI